MVDLASRLLCVGGGLDVLLVQCMIRPEPHAFCLIMGFLFFGFRGRDGAQGASF